MAAGDLSLGCCELVDGILVLGFELGEVLLVGVLVLDPGGVVGDRIFHHPRHNFDMNATGLLIAEWTTSTTGPTPVVIWEGSCPAVPALLRSGR
ncbi:MAG: hypothetical protein ACRCWS_02530 [Propionibacteriaceae bacterium]